MDEFSVPQHAGASSILHTLRSRGVRMDFEKVLADLHTELRNLDSAIESLERLQNRSPARRRGRPSKEAPLEKRARKTLGDAAGGKKRD